MFSFLRTKYLIDAIESLLKGLDRETTLGKLFLALIPLFLLLLLPVSWTGNEEAYFQVAYRRVAPEYFSEFHALIGQSNARFLTEYVLGYFIKVFGYEHAHSIARVTMALLYAASFSVLFAALKLSVLRSFIVIAFFLMAGQQILGSEWLFNGVEGKTFAYAAVVAAIGIALSGRWLIATFLVGVATYFHFLVGGFWALGLALLVIIRETSFQKALRICLLYFLIVSPLLVLIAFEQLGQQYVADGPSPDAIYASNAPFHYAPFYSKKVFLKWWSTGVITLVTLTLAFLVLAKRIQAPIPPLYILVLLLYLLLALVISFLDKDTFFFSKLYLFRPSSLILLLAIATVLSIDSVSREISPDTTTLVLRLAAVVIVSVFMWTQVKSKVDAYRKPQTFREFPSLITAIESESKPTEIVLIEPKNEWDFPYVGLHRRIPRPTLVSWKFVPTNPTDILRWHNLVEYRKSLFERGCSTLLNYPIRLILIFDPKTLDSVKNCGDIVWQSKSGYLIRVDDRWIFK